MEVTRASKWVRDCVESVSVIMYVSMPTLEPQCEVSTSWISANRRRETLVQGETSLLPSDLTTGQAALTPLIVVGPVSPEYMYRYCPLALMYLTPFSSCTVIEASMSGLTVGVMVLDTRMGHKAYPAYGLVPS